MNKIKKHILALVLLFSVTVPLVTAAQGTATVPSSQASQCDPSQTYPENNPCYSIKNPTPYTPLAPLPTCTGSGCSNNVNNNVQFEGYIQNTFNFIIFVAAAAAVFMITYGGFQYMTTDSVNGKSEGLKKARNAVYGLLLVLGSFLILRTIDPRLVAIPSTLVTPLNINYQDSSSSFLDGLINQVEQYNQSGQQSIENAKASVAQIQQLQSQRQTLCDQLIAQNSLDLTSTLYQNSNSGGIYNDQCDAIIAQSSALGSNAQALATQISGIENQIATTEASVIVSTSNSIMDNGGVSQTLNTLNKLNLNGNLDWNTIDKTVGSGLAFIEKTKNTRISQLGALGAYGEQAAINERATEDEVTIQLAGLKAKVENFQYMSSAGIPTNGAAAKQEINAQINSISQKIITVSNAETKNNMQTQLNTLKSTVSSMSN